MMDDEKVQIERFQFFSNAMLIKSLCSARAFERIEELRDQVLSNSDVKKDHLALATSSSSSLGSGVCWTISSSTRRHWI